MYSQAATNLGDPFHLLHPCSCCVSHPAARSHRYDEFGRRKRSKNEEDKRAREAAALQRLYGGTNLAPSELVRFYGLGC